MAIPAARETRSATEAGRRLSNSPSVTVEGPPTVPLTAELDGVPEAHDGESTFTFGLTFSEEPKVGYQRLRDEAFDVGGGAVRKARRRQSGSNLSWEITVEPDSPADVLIRLPETGSCSASGAICTTDGRPLSHPLSATVAGPPDEPLTARFVGMPAEHRGEGGFHFRVAFSEDIGISFQALREDAFTVSGGRVTGGRRVDDRRDLFRMTVEPDSDGDVTITLPAGRECGVSGAICTKGEPRRQLTNSPSATMAGPVGDRGGGRAG